MQAIELVEELERSLDILVQKLTPGIREERESLGLVYPQTIKVKPYVSPLSVFGSYNSEEDFIRLNIAQILEEDDELGEEDMRKVVRFSDYVQYINFLMDRATALTLRDTINVLNDPSMVKNLSFEHLPEEGQVYFASIQKQIIEHMGGAREDSISVTARALEAIISGKFEDIIHAYLRHETEHYVSPNNNRRRKLVQTRNVLKSEIKPYLESDELDRIDWTGMERFYREFMAHMVESTAQEEARAMFFNFAPHMEWTNESIDSATRTTLIWIDSYNPIAFLGIAVLYLIAKENARRVKEGNKNILHPEGRELWYILEKTSPKTYRHIPAPDPQKIDMGFVVRALYTELPKIQSWYARLAMTEVQKNQQYFKNAIKSATG